MQVYIKIICIPEYQSTALTELAWPFITLRSFIDEEVEEYINQTQKSEYIYSQVFFDDRFRNGGNILDS